MMSRLAFDRLIHSDWSVTPAKRWTAVAIRSRHGWLINRLEQTPPSQEFLQLLFTPARTLAGFDFPIGLPAFYLDKTGLVFCDLVSSPPSDQAQRFFTPAETLFDVSPAQPFYRKHPPGGRQADLMQRLACETFDDLLRACDRKTSNRSRAESIFWTVGAKQVGKAALAGWREILIPARERGAQLWPFDGPLASLDPDRLTLAETYPAEAYRHLGMNRTVKKRTQDGRKAAGAVLLDWASRHDVRFLPDIAQLITNGFGQRENGEDPFDAVAGLCGMVEVADGRRAEAPRPETFSQNGEGWILGQIDAPV
jgi:hypothetical protein